MLALDFPTLTDGRISCEERKKCRRCGGITDKSPLHFQSVLFSNRLQLLERRGILQACVCSFASPGLGYLEGLEAGAGAISPPTHCPLPGGIVVVPLLCFRVCLTPRSTLLLGNIC